MKWLITLFIISSVGVYFTTPSPKSKDRTRFYGDWIVPPPESVYFAFGFSEILADVLWLRVIQNFDFCERRDVHSGEIIMPYELRARARQKMADGPHQDSSSGLSAEEQAQLHSPDIRPDKSVSNSHPSTETKPSKGQCQSAWAYQMLDRITDYSPKFRIAYSMGATTLSVLVDDIEGASRLFEKALLVFPNDWVIQYRAAYHFLSEVHDLDRAAELLLLVGKNGGPAWAPSLAARLYSRAGQALLGKQVLLELLETYNDGPAADRLRERLAEIQKVLDEEEAKSFR